MNDDTAFNILAHYLLNESKRPSSPTIKSAMNPSFSGMENHKDDTEYERRLFLQIQLLQSQQGTNSSGVLRNQTVSNLEQQLGNQLVQQSTSLMQLQPPLHLAPVLNRQQQLRILTNQQLASTQSLENVIAQETLLRLRRQQLSGISSQHLGATSQFPANPLGLSHPHISTESLRSVQCDRQEKIPDFLLDDKSKQGPARTFPMRLHKILCMPEYEAYITWLPHGRAWRIINKVFFEKKVIPHHFRHARYASFMRQVSLFPKISFRFLKFFKIPL